MDYIDLNEMAVAISLWIYINLLNDADDDKTIKYNSFFFQVYIMETDI